MEDIAIQGHLPHISPGVHDTGLVHTLMYLRQFVSSHHHIQVSVPFPLCRQRSSRSRLRFGAGGSFTFGRYRNVFLSSAELAELQTELPSLWEQYIERLSEYMESSGKGYKNHAATIRRWANADKKKEEPPARNRDYSVEEGETI